MPVIKLNLRAHQTITAAIGLLLMALAALVIASARDTQAIIDMAPFFVLGFLLATWRHVLMVDTREQRVIRKAGCLILFTRATVSTQHLKRLTLKEKVTHKNSTTRTRYQIVAGNAGLICQLKNPRQARKVAEALATTLALPLDNRIYRVRSMRHPHQLDHSVAERWRTEGVRKERPFPPSDSQISVEPSATGVRISLPAEHHHLKPVALLAGAVALLAVIPYSLAGEEQRFIMHLLLAPFVYLLLSALLAFTGRSSIVVTNTHVVVRQGRSPLRRKLKLTDVEEFISARDGIYLDGDRGSAWIHWAGHKEDSLYLEALLAYEIARRQTA